MQTILFRMANQLFVDDIANRQLKSDLRGKCPKICPTHWKRVQKWRLTVISRGFFQNKSHKLLSTRNFLSRQKKPKKKKKINQQSYRIRNGQRYN